MYCILFANLVDVDSGTNKRRNAIKITVPFTPVLVEHYLLLERKTTVAKYSTCTYIMYLELGQDQMNLARLHAMTATAHMLFPSLLLTDMPQIVDSFGLVPMPCRKSYLRERTLHLRCESCALLRPWVP